MTEMTYSWNFIGDSEVSPQTDLPAEISVQRFALSHIIVPFKNYPERAITTVNLHPESWNSLMMPYGGLRIDDRSAAVDAKTFGELSQCLNSLIIANLDDYLDAACRELSEYYSEVGQLSELPPLYRNYSLKFSKSAMQWTAYVFTYHAAPVSLLAADGLQRGVIRMTPAAIESALRDENVDGVKLEENVVAFLKSPLVQFWASSAA